MLHRTKKLSLRSCWQRSKGTSHVEFVIVLRKFFIGELLVKSELLIKSELVKSELVVKSKLLVKSEFEFFILVVIEFVVIEFVVIEFVVIEFVVIEFVVIEFVVIQFEFIVIVFVVHSFGLFPSWQADDDIRAAECGRVSRLLPPMQQVPVRLWIERSAVANRRLQAAGGHYDRHALLLQPRLDGLFCSISARNAEL